MSRAKLRVATVQPLSSGPPQAVASRALRMAKDAIDRGAEVVCLPEHWIPGRHPDIEKVIPSFTELAEDTGAYIIPGADFSSRDGPITIQSALLGPSGEVGRVHKTHLFRRENRVAIPGKSLSTFDLRGVTVGIAICHDMVYPEVARIMTLRGAEVIFVPAMITWKGYAPWELYLSARSLENRVPVVSVNAFRPPRFPGGATAIDFEVSRQEGIVDPRVRRGQHSVPKVFATELDLRSIRKYREERLRSRRPELYSELSDKNLSKK